MRRLVQVVSTFNQAVLLLALLAVYLWLDGRRGPLVAGFVVIPLGGYLLLLVSGSRQQVSTEWVLWPWSLLSRELAAVGRALRSQRLTALGRYAEAAATADAGAARAKDGWAKAVCLQSAAIALIDAGDLAGAQHRLDPSEAAFRAAGDRLGALTSLNARGAIFSSLGRLADAEACYAGVLSEAQGLRPGRALAAAAQYNLGWTAYQRAEWEQAFRWWASTPPGASPQAAAWLRLGLARLALRQGDVAQVRGQLPERGPWRFRTKPAATRLVILAAADFREGDFARARARVERALELDGAADGQRLRDLAGLCALAAAGGVEDPGWWLAAARRAGSRISQPWARDLLEALAADPRAGLELAAGLDARAAHGVAKP
jgi:tetratricopeptide (TPR) repeat protein